MMTDLNDFWRDIDFKPAPEGWRIIFAEEHGFSVSPIAGWLIQERAVWHPETDEITIDLKPAQDRERRVVPAICHGTDGYEVRGVRPSEETFIMRIIGPGEVLPTEREGTRAYEAAREPKST